MRLSNLLNEVVEKEELHLYDFDGTLFRSPECPDQYGPGKGEWYRDIRSLTHPAIPERPDSSWWNPKLVKQAKESERNPRVYSVLATGRRDNPFAKRVNQLIRSANLSFDEVQLKPGGQTNVFKLGLLRNIINRHPTINVVRIWDDRVHHLKHFKTELANHDVDVYVYPVKLEPKPIECDISHFGEES